MQALLLLFMGAWLLLLLLLPKADNAGEVFLLGLRHVKKVSRLPRKLIVPQGPRFHAQCLKLREQLLLLLLLQCYMVGLLWPSSCMCAHGMQLRQLRLSLKLLRPRVLAVCWCLLWLARTLKDFALLIQLCLLRVTVAQ